VGLRLGSAEAASRGLVTLHIAPSRRTTRNGPNPAHDRQPDRGDLGYPVRPWDWKAPTGSDKDLGVGYWLELGCRMPDIWCRVTQPRSLDQSIVYPKEQALLDIAQREVKAGNQLWDFCTMTNKREVQPCLKRLLNDVGLRVAILRVNTVKPRKRLQWIEDNGPKCDVIHSHTELVKMGIDFFGNKLTPAPRLVDPAGETPAPQWAVPAAELPSPQP
jgi:hypothetical protein